jgi:hypothetical protein
MGILQSIISFLLQWYVWIPIVLVLGFLTWRNYRKLDKVETEVEGDLLILEIPKANDKKELAAEQLFASLHGILRDREELPPLMVRSVSTPGYQSPSEASSKDRSIHSTQPYKFVKPMKTT